MTNIFCFLSSRLIFAVVYGHCYSLESINSFFFFIYISLKLTVLFIHMPMILLCISTFLQLLTQSHYKNEGCRTLSLWLYHYFSLGRKKSIPEKPIFLLTIIRHNLSGIDSLLLDRTLYSFPTLNFFGLSFTQNLWKSHIFSTVRLAIARFVVLYYFE